MVFINLLPLFEEATKCFDISRAHVVYLDFQKAFDKESHDKLIIKIKTVEITWAISEWFWNWLRDKTYKSSGRRDLIWVRYCEQWSTIRIGAGATALPDL